MRRIAQSRSDLYAVLSLAFSPPSASLLPTARRGFLGGVAAKAWEELRLPEEAAEFEELKGYLEDTKSLDADEAFRRLAAQYTVLFDVPGRYRVQPYESLYRRRDGEVMGHCATAVIGFYQNEGLQLSPDFKDLPDHLAAEMEFMTYLCTQESEAWGAARLEDVTDWRAKQRRFLEQHVLQWVPEFCRQVTRAASAPFYVCMANLARVFITWERDNVVAPHATAPSGSTAAPRTVRVAQRCTLCEACVLACSRGALESRRLENRVALLLQDARCDGCGRCIDICPEGAITAHDVNERDGRHDNVLARADVGFCQRCQAPLGPIPLLLKTMSSLEKAGLGRQSVFLCQQCRADKLSSSLADSLSTVDSTVS